MKQEHGHNHEQTHGHVNHNSPQDGSIAEMLNVEWKFQPQQMQPGQDTEISITLKDKHGMPATAFSILHEKQMHLLAISKDLSSFQHLHPEYIGDGKFVVKMQFPQPGGYKLYADFMPEGGAQQLADFEVKVEGEEIYKQAEPDKELKRTVNGLDFDLKIEDLTANQHLEMSFTITDSATQEPVTNLQPYLGSAGHVVITSSDLEQFLHVHPNDENTTGPTVTYMTSFPKPGLYKIWGQFKHNGQLYTVPFVIAVPNR